MPEMSKQDPAYIAEMLRQKSQDDPKEIAIRDKIRAWVLQGKWPEIFDTIRQHQIDHLKEAAAHIQDDAFVHDVTQTVLKDIAELVQSKIVEGGELLERIPKGSPAIIVTNHFGAYKLLGISPKNDVGIDIPGYEAMYPYPMYFAAMSPVAEKIGDGLYYASNDFPGVFGDIHRKAGFIHVPALAESKTTALIEQTREAITKLSNSAIVSFPEGTTSGKPSGRGPWNLEPFKTGAYVIAAELGMYIVPVAQYFDPQEGYKLKVLEPFIPEKGNKEGYQQYADKNKREMQSWLDQCQRSN